MRTTQAVVALLTPGDHGQHRHDLRDPMAPPRSPGYAVSLGST